MKKEILPIDIREVELMDRTPIPLSKKDKKDKEDKEFADSQKATKHINNLIIKYFNSIDSKYGACIELGALNFKEYNGWEFVILDLIQKYKDSGFKISYTDFTYYQHNVRTYSRNGFIEIKVSKINK